MFGDVGAVYKRKGDLTAALENYRKAYSLRRIIASGSAVAFRQHSFAIAGMAVADVLTALNQNLDEAITLYREAIETLDELRPRYDGDVFRSYNRIGDILKSRNDPAGALKEYRVAESIARDSAAKGQQSRGGLCQNRQVPD